MHYSSTWQTFSLTENFLPKEEKAEKKTSMLSSGQTFHLGLVYLRIYLRRRLFNQMQSCVDDFILQILLVFVPSRSAVPVITGSAALHCTGCIWSLERRSRSEKLPHKTATDANVYLMSDKVSDVKVFSVISQKNAFFRIDPGRRELKWIN